MKVASLLFVLPLAGCGVVDVVSKVSVGSGPRVYGTGKPIRETRKAQAVSTIEAGGAMHVEVRKGAPKLVIEAQKEILKRIRTEYRGGRLVMWIEGNITSDGPIRAWYTGPNVSNIEGSGAMEFDAMGLSGGSSSIVLSGASKAKAVGRVGKLSVEASGASEANLKALESESAKVEASGASHVWVRTKGDLDASASGASEIKYVGKPSRVKGETNGAASVSAG
jgi:hypothetical protein